MSVEHLTPSRVEFKDRTVDVERVGFSGINDISTIDIPLRFQFVEILLYQDVTSTRCFGRERQDWAGVLRLYLAENTIKQITLAVR